MKVIWKSLLTMTLIFLIIICYVEYGIILDLQAKQYQEQEAKITRIESKFTQWIYDNSERISRKTCTEIAQEVMKTKNPKLMLSIIELESQKFTPGAQSRTKEGSPLALGWCQINYKKHAQELINAGVIKEVRDLWDIGPNIRAGEYILDQKLKQSGGDIPRALELYLGGKDGAYVFRILATHIKLSAIVD